MSAISAGLDRVLLRRPRRSVVQWGPTAMTMGALLLLYAAWQLLHWPASHRSLVGDVFFYPVSGAAMATAWRASRRCSKHRRLRDAWRLIAAAAGMYLLGDIGQTIYEFVGSKPYPSVCDALYIGFYPLLLLGLLRFPTGRRELQQVRLLLDLAVVAVAGGLVVTYVVLGPTVVTSGPDVLQTGFSIAYPVGDMVILVGLGSLLIRHTVPSARRALQFMAIGLLFYVAADLIYGYITLHGTYHGGDPVDALWMVAIALTAVAGAAQRTPEATETVAAQDERHRASWAPFIAVAVGFGLLCYAERHDSGTDFALVLGAMLLATLVAVRQYLAQRDLIETQGRLSYQSLHDVLTGLPNRALVIDRAEQMLARARRAGSPVAALYVDVDGFKHVNDSFGHAAGDELLRVIAARLVSVVREADTVGRLGGDEFVVLLEDSTMDAGPELVAERICQVLTQPVELASTSGRTLAITASVGIALGLRTNADELLRDADFALYEAKGAGKNRWTVFESRMQTAAQDRLELEMDLKDALERDELFLLYQPTFDLQSEGIIGLEALLRWRHPTRGVIAPNLFIPLAEDSGLIVPIGRWVLKTACEQAVVWQTDDRQLGMSINVSARQLDEPDLVDDVATVLEETGLNPRLLTLEITETTLMRDAEEAAGRLADLKKLGLRIAIDDFGTGYSSLAYLRQFPVDALKIDRSFISGIAASRESNALIHTLVQLGKTLGLETLGEGIEEQDQLRHLQREHCDSGQGFLFARPLGPEAIDELLDLSSEASRA
jgi:diguanylate cyclase